MSEEPDVKPEETPVEATDVQADVVVEDKETAPVEPAAVKSEEAPAEPPAAKKAEKKDVATDQVNDFQPIVAGLKAKLLAGKAKMNTLIAEKAPVVKDALVKQLDKLADQANESKVTDAEKAKAAQDEADALKAKAETQKAAAPAPAEKTEKVAPVPAEAPKEAAPVEADKVEEAAAPVEAPVEEEKKEA